MMNKYIRKGIFAAFVGGALMSCQDFLEKEPPSYLTPEGYYTSDDQVQAVVNKLYTDILPSHNGFMEFSSGIRILITKLLSEPMGSTPKGNGKWVWIMVNGLGAPSVKQTIR